MLASGDGKGTIKLWRDGRCIGNIRDTSANGHQGKIHCLMVHYCALGGSAGNVPASEGEHHLSRCGSIAPFSSTCAELADADATNPSILLVSASADNSVKLWKQGGKVFLDIVAVRAA
mgnify:FL=1